MAMHTNRVELKHGSVNAMADDTGMILSLYSSPVGLTIFLDHSEARAVAERIINALDNVQYQKYKEQDHAEPRN